MALLHASGRRLLPIVALILAAMAAAHADVAPDQTAARIPAGTFASVLPPAPGIKNAQVAAFLFDRRPVTNAQFAQFVQRHPEWRRDRVARVFADHDYLGHWSSATGPDAATSRQPVVRVSWFAASAYCESRGMRLPTWYEWEYVAAASATAADARNDPAWRQQILSWYSRSARAGLPDVGSSAANFYGVQDLHGVIWEWVHDLGGMLVAGDNREQSNTDDLRFCGPGALTMEQKENYATLMRVAMLSSMQASYTSATMGFRCAANLPEATR